MTIDKLADYLCEPEIASIDFIEVFRDYIDENADKKGLKNYRSALNSLIKFIGGIVGCFGNNCCFSGKI